jgi:hypothetical protein
MARFSLVQTGNAPTVDKNMLSNSSFEETLGSWIPGDGGPLDWTFSVGDGTPYSLRNTEKAVTGTYCLELVNDASGNSVTPYQTKTGLTENDTYVVTAQTATNGSSGAGFVVMAPVGEAMYAYNFTGASVGTYTIMVDDYPSEDQINRQANTSSMALTTFDSFTIHSSGIVSVLFSPDSIANEHLYIDDVTLKKDGTGSNIIADGSFDGTWEQMIVNGTEATGWQGVTWSVEDGEWFPDDVGDAIVFTDDSRSGSLAVDMAALDEGSAVGLKQQLTGLTAGNTYKIKVWCKDGESSGKAQIYALNGSIGSQTQAYDFVNEIWDADTNTSYSAISGADAGRRKILTGGVSYVQDVISLVAPANGIIDLAVFSPDGEDETTLIDDVELTEAKPSPAYGEEFSCIHYGFDMTIDGDANKEAIFTVPTGKKFLWRQCVVSCASVDNYSSGGTINIGWTAGSEYNDIMNAQQVDTTVGEVTVTDLGNSGEFMTAGEVVYAFIDDDPVSGKATADALTVDIYLFGMLIDA